MNAYCVNNWGLPFLDSGPVAQLGARLNGIQEVTGSIPVRSTNSKLSIPVTWVTVRAHR